MQELNFEKIGKTFALAALNSTIPKNTSQTKSELMSPILVTSKTTALKYLSPPLWPSATL